jgi:hypothetical protein
VRVEQFTLDALVPALHLPRRGGRPGFGQPLGDGVMPADPLKQHLGRARSPELTSELFAIEFLMAVKPLRGS